MRLLNTSTKRLELFCGDIPPYAILSHVWGKDEDELSFIHVAGSSGDRCKGKQRKGYAKVEAACSQAIRDKWKYIWIDTCCIDKGSSAELSEAINSMYRWYQNSGVCYAYLEDVQRDEEKQFDEGSDEKGQCDADVAYTEYEEDMEDVECQASNYTSFTYSKWFERGWTLQELIAPPSLIFYGQDWVEIGTKTSLQDEISAITGIRAEMITAYNPKKASIAEKMSWAAYRETKRVEDVAYC